MDEFFRGLDGRLRASGMLADSIMMGIVNSAMENAYKNSCSKKGALVRLNEKSRFCELATMQLEWCLKFLQEETEVNSVFESTCDREKLLSDLLVTRDRIHNRLKETELMIAEKDRELSERMEIESNLRLALDVKDEDITSLNTALGLEREKRIRNKKSMEKIGEVKSCVDEQLRKIKTKLEDGQSSLKSLMRRISSRPLDFDNLMSESDLDGEEGSSSNSKDVNSKWMLEGVRSLNLENEFKEMAIGMDILKENIDSSFKTMASSVSLFKTMLDEQQWVWNAEREAVNIMIKGFSKEVQYESNSDFGVLLEDVPHVLLDIKWVAFIDDIASLHAELQKLVPEMDMIEPVDKVNPAMNKGSLGTDDVSGASSRDNEVATGEGDKEPSSMFERIDYTEELCEESPSCRSVAQKIRTHEFIIQKKAIELESLKVKEKGNSTLRSERTLDSVKGMIARVNSSAESIMKERAKFAVYCDDHKWKVGRGNNTLQNSLLGSLSDEEDQYPKVVQSMGGIPEQSRCRSCCNLIRFELYEEIKQLSREKEDLDIKTILLEETYSIIFTGLMRRLHVEYFDCNIDIQIRDDTYRNILKEMIMGWRNNIETFSTERAFMEWRNDTYNQIRDDTYRNILREMIKEWRNNIETNDTDRLFMEETSLHILNEAVKDIIIYARNLCARKSQDEELSFHDGLFQRDDTYRNILREMIKEWRSNIETNDTDRLFMEETSHHILNEAVKDIIIYARNLCARKSQDEELSFHDGLFQSSQVRRREDLLHEPCAFPNQFQVRDDLELDFNSVSLEPNIHLDLDQGELEESDEQDVAFSSVNGISGRVFQQLNSSNIQLKEVESSIALWPLPPDGEDVLHDQVTSVIDPIEDAKHFKCLPTGHEESQPNKFQLIIMPLTEFSKKINEFEVIVCGKIRANMSRLEDLYHCVPPLIGQAISTKKQQTLYQKAFTRRCHDLQTAEVEVDLLGDEVDQLYGLIEKIYNVLNHYSPVLQHYHGIMDVLRLIRKELHGKETCSVRPS